MKHLGTLVSSCLQSWGPSLLLEEEMSFPPPSRHCPPKHLSLALSAGTNGRAGTATPQWISFYNHESDCDLGFNLRLSGLTAHQNHLRPVLAPRPRMIKSESWGQLQAQLFVWCLSSPGNCNVQPRWRPTGQSGYTMMAFNTPGQVPFSHYPSLHFWAQKKELSRAHFPLPVKPHAKCRTLRRGGAPWQARWVSSGMHTHRHA